MNRFYALQTHIQEMPDEGLKCIMDSRLVGTLALLSKFFDPTAANSDQAQVKKEEESDEEKKERRVKMERVKMNKWCWVFLGAWSVGEAGRVLEGRKSQFDVQPKGQGDSQ
jgi:hypothetical protein